jgi:transposase InsO family protein
MRWKSHVPEKPTHRRTAGCSGPTPTPNIPTREGKVYCAVVVDVFSRRVVGWSIDSSPTSALVTNTLGMAIEQRNPTGATVIHSD